MSKKSREERKAGQEITTHHRKPRSIGGSNDRKNISYISHNKHNAWHTLFTNNSAQAICRLINSHYLDPDYEFVCVRKEVICTDSSP